MDEETRIPFLPAKPSPMGKAKRRRLHRLKRKPTPPRCARQPPPREGARVDTPSFLWKEVSRRGGGWMGEPDKKERGRSSQVRRLREHPIHRCAVPLPQWGRLRYGDTAFLDTTPFPKGKAKRRRLRRRKRKPTPPRCARQPLPREGARVDTPSFLWKEVPRRGGGWMGMAV